MSRLKGVLPFLTMATLLLILFFKALFLDRVLVAADTLQFSLPWADSKDVQVQNWYPADSTQQFYPWLLYFKDRLGHGELPLWNPYSFCGHPLLANSQSGFLNPFNILFLLFRFTTAYNLRIILQLYAAGVFAYLYIRSLGIGRFGALMGGILYMLNGVFIAWLEWQWMIGGAIWLPLILLLLDKSWQRRSYLYAVLAGLPLAGSFLGGMLQQSLAMVFTVLLYTFVRAFAQYRETRRLHLLFRPFLLTGVACGIGFGLAAVQLFPTLELLAQSQRDWNLISNLPEWFRVFPRNVVLSFLLLVSFINPYWAGNVQSLDFRTLITWPTFSGNIVEYQGYVGMLALVLAAIAVFFWRSRNTMVFLSVAVLTLFFSFATPLNLVLYYRGFFAYTFSVAVLAALGAHYLVSAEEARASLARVNGILSKLLGVLLAVLVCGNVILFVWREPILRFGRAYLGAHSLRNYLALTNNVGYIFGRLEALYQNYLITSPSMLLSPVVLGAIIATFAAYRRRRLSAYLFRVACFGIVAVELLYFGTTFTPMVEAREIFPSTSVTSFLQQDEGLYRVLAVRDVENDPPIMPPNTHLPYGIQSIGWYDSLFPRRYAEVTRLIETGNIDSLEQEFYQAGLMTRYDSPLLDMLNVKYVLVGPQRQIDDPRFRKVFDGELRIYENRKVLPRAFVVPSATIVKDRQDLLSALMSQEFDPRKQVLLEADPPEGVKLSNAPGESFVEVLTYSPQRIVMRARLAEDAFLVLSDGFFPGWKAYVDGVETPILRANYILRAVFLKGGENEVEFVYDPCSFKAGKWVSASTILALVLVPGMSIGIQYADTNRHRRRDR